MPRKTGPTPNPEHEAEMDAAIDAAMGLAPSGPPPGAGRADPDEDPEEIEQEDIDEEDLDAEEEEAEVETDEAEVETDEAEEELPDDEELDEEDDEGETYADSVLELAEKALGRDGLPKSLIRKMSDREMVEAGLKAHARQTENDRAYGRLQQLEGNGQAASAQEAASGQEAGSGEPETGPAHPAATGAEDLTEAALPFAQKIAELDDPQEVAAALVAFQTKASQGLMQQVQQQFGALQAQFEPLMTKALQDELGADFEGDVDALMPLARSLAQGGLHSELKGISKAAALIKAAHAASGGKARKTRKATSRARQRGAAPPVKGRSSPPQKLTAEQKTDRRIARIMNGERDPNRINRGL